MSESLDTATPAKGKRLGKRRVVVDASRIALLHNASTYWATVCEETGLNKGTAQRTLYGLPKRAGELFGQIVGSAT